MDNLKRISIGRIENLTERDSVEEMGRGDVEKLPAIWQVGKIVIHPANFSRYFTYDSDWNRDSYLSFIDEILEKEGMFLADAEYRNNGLFFFRPKMKGTFYKGETQ